MPCTDGSPTSSSRGGARQPCEGHEVSADNNTAHSASTALNSSESPADNGLTYSEAEAVQRRDGRRGVSVVHLPVKPNDGGMLVRWNAKQGNVLFTPATTCTNITNTDAAATAAVIAGDWVKAARLVAREGARAVQLTILNPSFRVYVDGQRLARVGSPVLVHPLQRVVFASNPAVYSVTPATTNTTTAANAAPEQQHRPPLMSPVVHRQHVVQRPRTPSHSPLPRVPPSPLPHSRLQSAFPSPSNTCSGSLTGTGAPAGPDVSDSRMADEFGPSPGSEALPGHRSVTSMELKSMRVRGGSAVVQAMPVKEAAKALVPCSECEVDHTTCVVDMCTAANVEGDPHRSDVVGSSLVAIRAVTSTSDREGRLTAQQVTRDTKGVSKRMPFSTTTSSSSLTEEEARHQRRRPPPPPPPQQQPHQPDAVFVWGPVTAVTSPNWRALAVQCNDYGRYGEDGQTSSESDFDGDAFAAALQLRWEQRSQRPQQGARNNTTLAARAAPMQNRAVLAASSLRFAAAAAVAVAVGPHLHGGSRCLSWSRSDEADTLNGPATHPSPSALSSHPASSVDWRGGLAWDTDKARVSGRRGNTTPVLNESLWLKQRVTVAPFVVEAFGGTHRYRPLTKEVPAFTTASMRDSNDNEGEGQGGTRRLPEQHSNSTEEGPWVYPPAADELVTPHTEAALRRAVQMLPERSVAAKKASFLHDALLRMYDATTDHFIYAAEPDLQELLYEAFMTVSEELMVALQQDRPVRRLRSPLLCAGDLFGSFKDVLVLLSNVAHFTHWSMIHLPLVLTGNYVDGGWHSVEVMMLLCSWVYLQPTKVHLLRGPHEDPQVNGNYVALGKRCLRYKCRQRFGARKGLALWGRLNQIFAVLPVAAVVDDNVFIVHGGVPQLLPSPAPEGKGVDEGQAGGGTGAAWHVMSEGAGDALYSNTSGVPTPTTAATESASKVSSSHAGSPWSAAASSSVQPQRTCDSWRPPSAVQVFPSAMEGHCVVRCSEGAKRQRRGNCVRGDRVNQNMHRIGAVVDVGGSLAGAEPFINLRTSGVTQEKMMAPQPMSTASAVDTVADHDGITPRGAPSLSSTTPPLPPLSLASASIFRDQGESYADHHEPTDSSTCHTDPSPLQPFSTEEMCKDPSILCAPTVSARVVLPYAAVRAPPTGDFSYFDSIYAAQNNLPQTPLLYQSSASVALVALSNDEPSPLVFDAKDAGSIGDAAGAVLPSVSSSHTVIAASEAGGGKGRHAATSYPADISNGGGELRTSSAVVHASRETPTEADFEQLLRASTMRDYSFHTLQPARLPHREMAEGCSEARRSRLVRELLWNRPRDVAAKINEPTEDGRTADGAVRQSWWLPCEVRCCHACSLSATTDVHRCCHVFGSDGLLHFLDRYKFSLLVRGAPEETSDIYGALLSEDGRLLSLLTCTRLRKAPLQAAACVLQANSLQLATWGTQTLADSRGQVSLSKLSAIQGPYEERREFCRFLGAQVDVRLREHDLVDPHNQFGMASAYGEFHRQRAVQKHLEEAQKLPSG